MAATGPVLFLLGILSTHAYSMGQNESYCASRLKADCEHNVLWMMSDDHVMMSLNTPSGCYWLYSRCVNASLALSEMMIVWKIGWALFFLLILAILGWSVYREWNKSQNEVEKPVEKRTDPVVEGDVQFGANEEPYIKHLSSDSINKIIVRQGDQVLCSPLWKIKCVTFRVSTQFDFHNKVGALYGIKTYITTSSKLKELREQSPCLAVAPDSLHHFEMWCDEKMFEGLLHIGKVLNADHSTWMAKRAMGFPIGSGLTLCANNPTISFMDLKTKTTFS